MQETIDPISTTSKNKIFDSRSYVTRIFKEKLKSFNQKPKNTIDYSEGKSGTWIHLFEAHNYRKNLHFQSNTNCSVFLCWNFNSILFIYWRVACFRIEIEKFSWLIYLKKDNFDIHI